MAKPRQDSSVTRPGRNQPLWKNCGKQHQCPKPACLSDLCSGQAHPDGAGAGRLWELRMRLPQGHVVWKVAILYGRALLRQKARTSAQQSGVKSQISPTRAVLTQESGRSSLPHSGKTLVKPNSYSSGKARTAKLGSFGRLRISAAGSRSAHARKAPQLLPAPSKKSPPGPYP